MCQNIDRDISVSAVVRLLAKLPSNCGWCPGRSERCSDGL